MVSATKIGDHLAIGAALICGIHCFLAPVLLSFIGPLGAWMPTDNDQVHFWMLIGVLPTSFATLAMGCRKHKNTLYFGVGFLGLGILTFSSIWGHRMFGCTYEKYITLAGSLVLSFAHINNYLLCRNLPCTGTKDPCNIR